MILTYDISDLQPYINWVYFYFAWQLKDKAEQQRIRSEAETFLQECEGHYQAYALFQIVEAHAEGEDSGKRKEDAFLYCGSRRRARSSSVCPTSYRPLPIR